MSIKIQSRAFQPNAPIPKRYSRDGDDVSPPLSWSGIPDGTQEIALICEDPDAPMAEPFVHWLLRGIPPDSGGLEEGTGAGVPGRTDWGENGYGGPQPPVGHGVHRYFFRVHALDGRLDLKQGYSIAELRKAMKGHILAEGELIGTYERRGERGAEG